MTSVLALPCFGTDSAFTRGPVFMSQIDLRRDVIDPYLEHLKSDPSFALISAGVNSFEGWVKWDLVVFASRRVLGSPSLDLDRVGVESREPLGPGKRDEPKEKLIDFWIAADRKLGPHDVGYHCVELKVVFTNQNLQKQARSAASDLVCLQRLDPSVKAKEVGCLIFVRFSPDPDDRNAAIAAIKDELGAVEVETRPLNANVTVLVVVKSAGSR